MENCCRIRRIHDALDATIPPISMGEKLAGGFGFTEGPVWVKDSYLLFSDIPNNVIFKWDPNGGISEFLKPSGYHGPDATPGALLGSNGLTLDRQGRLIICEHGNRRLTRLEKNGSRTVLADRYEGKRLNSPNDVVCKSDDALYFTDPPYGLPKRDTDPAKELSFNGLYRLAEGRLQLLHEHMSRPNGLAFSPDEKSLYVANSDHAKKIWMRFEVEADGTLSRGEVFHDATQVRAEGLPDGMKLDRQGNLYCTGPGGIWVFSPEGLHLGNIELPEIPANCNWGDDDGKTLYITARTGLYRIKLNIEGIRP
jgi:gluconolactonase